MTINSKYFRHRLYPRLRHGRKTGAFISGQVTDLASSASAQTVVPLRTTNTKAELLVTIGGQPTTLDTITIAEQTYKFIAALTEAKAARTLTNDGTDVTALDTVTIGGQVYTFKSALTEVKATGTLTNDTVNVTNLDTVTIGSKVYTFESSLTNVDGHVKIAASAALTLTNLFHAINASGGTVGTDYATLTTANTQVVATNPSATTVVLTAILSGTAANSIATTENGTHTSFGAATLTGGVDPVANEVKRGVSNTATMTALYEAINAGANGGTDYSRNTVANASVVATNPTGTTVVATAILPGVAGNLIAIAESSTHLAWASGALVLAGGVDPVLNEVLIDDTAAHTRDNLVLAITAGASAGTKYATGTVANPRVTAAASGANMLLTALLVANLAPGKDIHVSESAANYSVARSCLDGPLWTATGHAYVDGEGPVLLTSSVTLPAGSPDAGTELFVHVVDANTIALAAGPDALRNFNFIQTTDAGSGTHSVTRSVVGKGIFDLLKRNKPRTVDAATDIDSLR